MDLPRGLAFSPDSKTIYITNFNSGRIMKWALPAGPSVSLFDDFEDGDNTNAFGGTWQLTGGLAGTLAFEVVSNEGYNSTHSLHVTGNYANWPGVEGSLDASSAPVDVSGYNGIQFAVKAVTVDTLRVRIREQKRVDNGTYEFAKFDFVP
ncbi:MAG TPA: carbohydrate binding domain-containing protein, partial [Bacteroidia bacterium]|nr:carbohydrate binding domain-containing protein [Bacteroidia bacterium]